MNDPYNLNRFIRAQSDIFDEVVAELRAGKKHSHWMWFVFPQLQGLGRSEVARRYSITSIAEARAYLQHEILGPRLRECSRSVSIIQNQSIEEIFGWPDYLKLHSSMTLFARSTSDNQIFLLVLEKYFNGIEDQQTLDRL
ncbi:DUF1810 domain-containing protein [Nocardia sp. KC 131]|uniref:DUF1810 domain-containing protein n=1 Tax=Nocardia arseniciresistens TaxID=3392119 RepID=UPI00398E865C